MLSEVTTDRDGTTTKHYTYGITGELLGSEETKDGTPQTTYTYTADNKLENTRRGGVLMSRYVITAPFKCAASDRRNAYGKYASMYSG